MSDLRLNRRARRARHRRPGGTTGHGVARLRPTSRQGWLSALVTAGIVANGLRARKRLRSLAVLPAYRSYGVGGLIVRGLVERARERGIPTVFALTRAVQFFERLGFVVTERERFPEKVWRDCVVCPLQHACDETAVVMEL